MDPSDFALTFDNLMHGQRRIPILSLGYKKHWRAWLGQHTSPLCRLRYGRMVKALACRVEGPGFKSHHGKSFGTSFGKKKKPASYPLLA